MNTPKKYIEYQISRGHVMGRTVEESESHAHEVWKRIAPSCTKAFKAISGRNAVGGLKAQGVV